MPPTSRPMEGPFPSRLRSRARVALALAFLAILVVGGSGGELTPLGALPAPHSGAAAPLPGPTDLSPHASFQTHPAATGVNPYGAYSKEPAPMGIADYGLGPGGVPYRYTTPEFEGTLHIGKLDAYTDPANGNDVTFQLNVVVLLQNGSRQAQFWVQDALFLNSTAGFFVFGNNVWNFSSGSSGSDQANSIVGNGTISNFGVLVYNDFAGSGYPGSNTTLGYPINVTTRVIASSIRGVPHVGLAYDDGFGFVTYDNVSFPWAHGWTVDGFVVDGTTYNPIGIYDDAEWDYDGPGGGNHARNVVSNLTMGLAYWNGHNLQSVANAYNFGSDTAEATYNVVDTLAGPVAGPTPQASLVNASGTLGLLYDRSSIALVNISSPTPNGTLWVDGSAVPFVGGAANLTLSPGNHTIRLVNATGPVGTKLVALTPGEYLRLSFAPRPLPQVLTVEEVGLPVSTSFGVTVNGTFAQSTNGAVTFEFLNGTYAYTVTPVAGWELADPYRGMLTVNGSTLVTFEWRIATFPVTSTAENLPTGVTWTIAINGTSYPGGDASAVVSLPNGTYPYVVTVGITYLPEPDHGDFRVTGSATVVTVLFGLDPGTLNGVVDPQNATVTVGGAPVAVVGGVFTVTEVPGTYEVVATATGFNATFRNVTVTAGNTSVVDLALTPTPPPSTQPRNPAPPPGGAVTLNADEWLALALGVVIVAGVLAVLVGRGRARPPRRRPPRERPADRGR